LKNILKLRENLDFNINRIVIGLFILTLTLISFFFKYDFFLYFLVLFLSIYEIYKNNFANIKEILIFLIFLSFLLIFYNDYDYLVFFIIIFFFLFTVLAYFKFLIKISFFICLCLFLFLFFILINIDRNLFYLIIFISFFNDSLAYFFGKLFGGKKIIPSISPSKTWSGTLFSFFLTFFVFTFVLKYEFFFSILCSISLFFGDLFFSYVKRNLNIKDFSNILSSHGGILDRIDSMFLITPIIILQMLL
jgi:phosphatidate cytidylyltransferase